MRSVTDRPLCRRARGPALARSVEDAEAFHEFYVANAQRMVMFFVRRTFDPELALDLAAETFATALQCRRQFRGRTEAEAEAWLFAIARSQLAVHRRRRVAERRALEQLGPDRPSQGLAELERIEELAGLPALRRTMRSAIAGLSREQAYAVHQRVVCERGYGELAAELGVSEDVVRARVSRGLRALAAATAAGA